MQISVIIPTRDRPDKLAVILACLKQQIFPASDYEIIVVDDGSSPPVTLPTRPQNPRCDVVRLQGLERSSARNAGARVATGDLLVFVDDDMTVGPDFLSQHLGAHGEWPDALLVGAIRLPDEILAQPFGRFRHKLEQQAVPHLRGLTRGRNFCAAANMAISRDVFQRLQGFDHAIVSSEDQDFALRHTTYGGRIAFLPEAEAIHHDSALDLRSYCRRAEWGSTHMIPFCQRYPEWPDNIERERVNGRVHWGCEPLWQSVRKMLKAVLALRPVIAILFAIASRLEAFTPNSLGLDRIYRLLLGAHLFRGYRQGLQRYGDEM